MAKFVKDAAALLFPLPVVLVGCAAGGYRPNLITLAWAGVAASEPPVISIGVRPERHSHTLIKQSGEFVVNIPDQKMLEAVDYCGQFSGRDVDKYKEAQLTAAQGHTVSVPHIAEAPVCLECKVRQTVPLGSHDLFLGEVTAVLIEDRCLTGGNLDLARVQAVAYGNGRYWAVGAQLGTYGFARHRK